MDFLFCGFISIFKPALICIVFPHSVHHVIFKFSLPAPSHAYSENIIPHTSPVRIPFAYHTYVFSTHFLPPCDEKLRLTMTKVFYTK